MIDEEMTTAPTALEIDWDLYESWLADTGLTDEEKRQFLEALWSLIVMFVDMGFGLHAAQQDCGQDRDDGVPELAWPAPDMVSLSEEPISSTAEQAASPDGAKVRAGRPAERSSP